MELNKQNFIQIVNSNRGLIRSLCKVYYGCIEDQKDAFQDVILQLWKSFDTFRGESEISTWIYRVSLNTILTKIRRDKKSATAEPIDTPHLYISNAKADDNVELLSMIMQSLKDVDKAIVVLYLEGYRNKEIAEILKMSQTNVATRLNRVKSQLKMKFNNKSHAAKQS
jgi:RNA polymerase sigma-70 factor, ECF subfamily